MKGRIARRLAVTLSVAALAGMLSAVPASAASFTNVAWSVSNNASSVSGVSYTYSFTTATTGTIASITFGVPAGTAGTPAVVLNYGIGAGTVGLASNTITYTVTSPVSVAGGIPILIEIGGLTNTPTIGSYTSAIATRDSVPANIDTATSNSMLDRRFEHSDHDGCGQVVDLHERHVGVHVPDGSGVLRRWPISSVRGHLTVKTNASLGYALAVKDSTTGLYSTVLRRHDRRRLGQHRRRRGVAWREADSGIGGRHAQRRCGDATPNEHGDELRRIFSNGST